jgi:hypothetical protein
MQARAGGVDELLQSGVLEGVGGDTDSHSPGFGATITRFLPTSFRNAFSLAFLRATPASAVTGSACPVPRTAMSHVASGGRTVEPVTEEDF